MSQCVRVCICLFPVAVVNLCVQTLTRLCSACCFVTSTDTLREAQKYPFHYLAMAGDVDALVMC